MIRRRSGARAGLSASPERTASRSATVESSAWLGRARQAARTATPDALARLLRRLDDSGDIHDLEDTVDASDLEDALIPEDSGPEIDGADEDAVRLDATASPGSDGNGEAVGSDSLNGDAISSADSAFELLVTGSRCELSVPSWALGHRARTSSGRVFMDAFEHRLGTLEAIANWLTASRGPFLQSADAWDLGPSSAAEVRAGRVTVFQKDLCAVLSLDVDSGTFSRHIGQARLVWDDAWAPLSLLFSARARLAWGASGVLRVVGRRLSAQEIALLQGAQPPRSRAARASLLARPPSSMDVVDLVRYVCLLADCRWEDVWRVHSDRLGEGHDQTP